MVLTEEGLHSLVGQIGAAMLAFCAFGFLAGMAGRFCFGLLSEWFDKRKEKRKRS